MRKLAVIIRNTYILGILEQTLDVKQTKRNNVKYFGHSVRIHEKRKVK